MEAVGAVNYEVNFDACFRAPEKELVAATAVVVPGGEMLKDETFQAGPVDFAWTVQWTFGSQRAEYASVEEVIFVVSDEIAFGAFGEDGKTPGDEHVLQNLEVAVNRRTLDAGVSCDIARRKQLTVGEGCRFKESGEGFKIADDSFARHFFLKIEVESRDSSFFPSPMENRRRFLR